MIPSLPNHPDAHNELSIQHSDNIEGEESGLPDTDKDPLVGPPMPLEELRIEYQNNPSFLRKLTLLENDFIAIRRVRKDGCCFYRAYLYGLLEHLMKNPDLVKDYLDRLGRLRQQVAEAGYTQSTIEDFYESFVESVELAGSADVHDDPLAEVFDDATGTSNHSIVYLRVLTGSHLKLNAQHFTPFLSTHSNIDQFCASEVDPMWKEAEQIQILALTSVLESPVVIVYVDGSDQEISRLIFPEIDKPPVTHLLYRPGHYDIIYPSAK